LNLTCQKAPAPAPANAQQPKAAPKERKLAPVIVNSVPRPASQLRPDRIEIEFPNGIRLRAAGFGHEGLTQLMRTLGGLA
jgi:hypothetical protein